MKTKALLIAALALTACSNGSETTLGYNMPEADVRTKLLDAEFEQGAVSGYSILTPRIKEKDDGSLQWLIVQEEQDAMMTGWKCNIQLEPAGENGERTKVVSQCDGLQSGKSGELDALIAGVLSKPNA